MSGRETRTDSDAENVVFACEGQAGKGLSWVLLWSRGWVLGALPGLASGAEKLKGRWKPQVQFGTCSGHASQTKNSSGHGTELS